MLKEVSQMADANSLQTKTIKTLQERARPNYSEQPIQMSFSGDFNGFYSFLLQLEQLPRIIARDEHEASEDQRPRRRDAGADDAEHLLRAGRQRTVRERELMKQQAQWETIMSNQNPNEASRKPPNRQGGEDLNNALSAQATVNFVVTAKRRSRRARSTLVLVGAAGAWPGGASVCMYHTTRGRPSRGSARIEAAGGEADDHAFLQQRTGRASR